MNRETTDRPQLLQWGVAGRPLPGEIVSGDRHLVKVGPKGTLLAVIDGLGHGPEAAEAAEAAVAALDHFHRESMTDMVKYCHESLRRTRGVALSLAWFSGIDDTMTWLSVGDVDGVLLRTGAEIGKTKEHLLMRGGVVGYQLPPLRPVLLPIRPGDLLIMATDGVRSNFAEGLDTNAPAQQIADLILAQFNKGTDDALVLAARYLARAT